MKISIVGLIGTIYLAAMVFFTWGVLTIHQKWFPHSYLMPVILEVEEATGTGTRTKTAWQRLYLHPMEFQSQFSEGGYLRREPNFVDDGYLLLSRFDRKLGQTIIELFSLERGEVLHTWVPDLAALAAKQGGHRFHHSDFRACHPYLLEDGSIVATQMYGTLFRLDREGKAIWANWQGFHHSVERYDEKRLLVPRGWMDKHGDHIAFVDIATGQILDELRLFDILAKSEHRALVYGMEAPGYDPIHLNDAERVKFTAGALQDGDIMWSARSISSIGVIRPSTREIVWIKTGPWLAQHDINQIGPTRYSLLGNDISLNWSVQRENLVNPNKVNEVYIYDSSNQTVETPYTAILEKAGIATIMEGRLDILPNGDLFIEENYRNRLVRLSGNGIRWEFINEVAPGVTAALHWCRYLRPEQVPAQFLAAHKK